MLKKILKSYKTYVIFSLVLLIYVSNFIFNRIENGYRKPYHFVFDLSQARTGDNAGQPLPITEDEIKEVDIAGSFNGWADPNLIENKLEGSSGWTMNKVSPGRWELFQEIPPDRTLHTYKYRIKPRDPAVLKRLKQGADEQQVWLPDMNNPVRINDNYGSFNSGIEIRTVSGIREVVLTILVFLTALFIAMPLFKYGILVLLRLPFKFLWKFIFISVFIGACITSALILAFGSAIYTIESQRDSELAEFVLGAAQSAILEAFTAPPPDTFEQLLYAEDSFSTITRRSSFLDIGFTALILYRADGETLRNADHLHAYPWWKAHMDQGDGYFNAIKEFGRKITHISEPAYGNFYAGPFDTWKLKAAYISKIISFMVTGNIIGQPYLVYIYPVKSYRSLKGYIVIRFLQESEGARKNLVRFQLLRTLFLKGAVLTLIVLFIALCVFGIFGTFLAFSESFEDIK